MSTQFSAVVAGQHAALDDVESLFVDFKVFDTCPLMNISLCLPLDNPSTVVSNDMKSTHSIQRHKPLSHDLGGK